MGVERVLRRARADVARLTPAILLIAVAVACWAITAQRMQGMDMGPGTDLGGLGWFAVVWATMMAAMMLPSLVPMALAYAGASRNARSPFKARSALAPRMTSPFCKARPSSSSATPPRIAR